MAKGTDKVNLPGTMAKCLKENGKTERKMGMECGSLLKEITMRVSGSITDKMAKAITII
mgnify:CR=1 FL=1